MRFLKAVPLGLMVLQLVAATPVSSVQSPENDLETRDPRCELFQP